MSFVFTCRVNGGLYVPTYIYTGFTSVWHIHKELERKIVLEKDVFWKYTKTMIESRVDDTP